MIVAASALKHRIDPVDALRALSTAVWASDPYGDPSRHFSLGCDGSGRLLELVVLAPDVDDEDNEPRLIHAMKARSQYAQMSTD